uniref:Ig-like domain-containing protein n=1 Tax=Neogobius melanostomus TaxID=47308 RepID=A0A8C6SPZ7_9GOBI
QPSDHETTPLLCFFLFYTDSPQDTEAEIKSHDVREGQSVTLSCSAKGQPPPTFTWYRYSQGKNPATQHSGAVWEINSAQIQDSGEYVCLAKNKHGEQRSKYVQILRVSLPPPYTQGQRLTLTCDVHSCPSGRTGREATSLFHRPLRPVPTTHSLHHIHPRLLYMF